MGKNLDIEAGADEYETLTRAYLTFEPQCLGDPRFTDEITPAEEVAELCEICPIFRECGDYGRAAKPQAGIWAGKRWRRLMKANDATTY